MQTRVLIIFEADAMLGSRGPRQKRSSRSAVQIVNDVVAVPVKLASDSRPGRGAVAWNSDHSIDQIRSIEDRRDPIFQENIDARLRQKPAQRKQRRRSQNRVANRAQANDQNAPDAG